MPIGVNPTTDDNIGVDTNAVSPTVSTNPPKAGTVLGVAVKSDTGRDPFWYPRSGAQTNKYRRPK